MAQHCSSERELHHENTPDSSCASNHELRKRFLRIYKAKRNNNVDYDPPVSKLIEWIGGIDVVMEVMLSSDDLKMTPMDITKLEQHLSAPSVTRITGQSVVCIADETRTFSGKPNHIDSEYVVDPKDNLLESFSPFISKHLYSKCSVAIMAAMTILPHVVGLTPDIVTHENEASRISRNGLFIMSIAMMITWLLYPIPWIFTALLSVNRAMWGRIARLPDMWIIIGTASMMFIYNGIDMWLSADSNVQYMGILFNLVWATLGIPFFVLCCSIDGIYGWSHKSKTCLMLGLSFTAALGSYTYEFHFDDAIYQIPGLGEYGTVSLSGKISNAAWVLCLFFAKFAFNAWHKGENTCIALKSSPIILWKEQMKQSEQGTAHTITPISSEKNNIDSNALSQQNIVIEAGCHSRTSSPDT